MQGGKILVILGNHRIHYERGLGKGTNNYVEINAVTILISIAWEEGINAMNIYGGSKLVAKWMMGDNNQMSLGLYSSL
jgi:ribonuclease HI